MNVAVRLRGNAARSASSWDVRVAALLLALVFLTSARTLSADGAPPSAGLVPTFWENGSPDAVRTVEERLQTLPVVSGNLRPYQPWTIDQWERELRQERALGFDLLWLSHLQPALNARAPADPLGDLLDLCQRLGMQVILSTDATPDWYGTLDLQRELAAVGGNITQLAERYGDHPAFFAWYIPHEIYFSQGDFGTYIDQLYATLVRRCKAALPAKPVTLSPFFILDQDQVFGDFHYATPAEYQAYWTRLIRRTGIDIIMLQDSGEHFSYVTNEQRRPFFQAMQAACRAGGAHFWANVETAEAVCPSIEEYVRRYGRVHHSRAAGLPWRAVPIDRLAGKLQLAAKYCERIVSWGYFQYGRPDLGADARAWHEAYRRYALAVRGTETDARLPGQPQRRWLVVRSCAR